MQGPNLHEFKLNGCDQRGSDPHAYIPRYTLVTTPKRRFGPTRPITSYMNPTQHSVVSTRSRYDVLMEKQPTAKQHMPRLPQRVSQVERRSQQPAGKLSFSHQFNSCSGTCSHASIGHVKLGKNGQPRSKVGSVQTLPKIEELSEQGSGSCRGGERVPRNPPEAFARTPQ